MRTSAKAVHGRLFFVFLLEVLILTGCHGPWGNLFLPVALDPSPSLKGVGPVPDSHWMLTLFAHLEIRKNQEYSSVKAAIAMQKPSSLRMEFLPPLGGPILFLTLQGKKFHVYLPQKGEFLRGDLMSPGLHDYLPLPKAFPLDNLAALLMGSPSPEFFQAENGAAPSLLEDASSHRQVFLDGYRYAFWRDRDGLFKKLAIDGKSGNPVGVIEWQNYRKIGSFAVPHRIRITSGEWDVTLNYREVQPSTEFDSNLFLLEIPAGIVPMDLESEKGEERK